MSSNYNLLLVSQLLSIKDKSVNFITFNNISCFFFKWSLTITLLPATGWHHPRKIEEHYLNTICKYTFPKIIQLNEEKNLLALTIQRKTKEIGKH